MNQCTGTLYGKDGEGTWHRLAELSLAGVDSMVQDCGPLVTTSGQSLWTLVRDECGRAANAVLAREVHQTWLANLAVIGSDPNALPEDVTIAIRCEGDRGPSADGG